ncbi:MAG: multidrug efflux pump subunit AcrA (membrane-fusion protein) [Myxococcota bacterium]|jgi:multidrug efflux pump subunit AcrA (membrane-fusion protein)
MNRRHSDRGSGQRHKVSPKADHILCFHRPNNRPGPVRTRIIIPVVIASVGGALALNRARNGPQTTAYRAVHQPISQTLLVTGRVALPARTHPDAMVQNTVVEAAVEEDEIVEAGTLLMLLADDEVAARVRDADTQMVQAAARLRRAPPDAVAAPA